MKVIFLFSLTLFFVSCSGSKPVEESMEAGIELADAVEFTEEAEDIVAENVEPAAPVDGMIDPMAVNPMEMDAGAAPVEIAGGISTYTVQENETLMMIAFKIYGDYGKWKEIAELNQATLNGSNRTVAGMELQYNAPAEPFVFAPAGNPYLIVKNDTLGIVSQKTYGEPVHWRAIWENNRPLIKDPNIIFAGFTIYTPILEGRDVAFDAQ